MKYRIIAAVVLAIIFLAGVNFSKEESPPSPGVSSKEDDVMKNLKLP